MEKAKLTIYFLFDKQRESVLLPDNHVQDEEKRHKEVPRFCVNSLLEAEKAWTPSLLLLRGQGLTWHLNHLPASRVPGWWESRKEEMRNRDVFQVEECKDWKGNLCWQETWVHHQFWRFHLPETRQRGWQWSGRCSFSRAQPWGAQLEAGSNRWPEVQEEQWSHIYHKNQAAHCCSPLILLMPHILLYLHCRAKWVECAPKQS